METFAQEIAVELTKLADFAPQDITLEFPKDRALGDFALPCFAFAKEHQQPPAQIAAELEKKWRLPHIQAKAVGPYLNFKLEVTALADRVLPQIFNNPERYGSGKEGSGKNIVIDYSSPNIAKPFGVGHIRSTMIGAALKKLLEFRGYHCIGINHLGDWGMQFGRMLLAVKLYDPQETFRHAENPSKAMLDLYVKIHAEEEKNPALKEHAREWFQKLEAGNDKETKRLWSLLVEISWQEFARIYELLGVSFEKVQGESFYESKLQATLERIIQTGITEISEGALIVSLEQEKLGPCLLKTGDGTTLYATRDLAALFYRYETWKFVQALYVVGNEQQLHFRQLKAVLKRMQLPWADNIQHIGFGMMKLKEGKMSTRKGRVIFLDEVLTRAVELADQIIAEKNPSLQNRETVAKAVGIGAVIFNDLKNTRTKDVLFDWDTVLNFDGETGPYVQYSHARLCSILRKYAQPISWHAVDYKLLQEGRSLLALLARFPQYIQRACKEYEPSIVAGYLLEVAKAVNQFYKEHRVLEQAEEITQARISLVAAARVVLGNGLQLLGIQTPEEM